MRDDPVASAYAQIRSHLLTRAGSALAKQDGAMTIVLTSRRRQEGVSTVCCELAQSLQEEIRGEVLLVDSASGTADLAQLVGAECRPVSPELVAELATGAVLSTSLVNVGTVVPLPVLRIASPATLEADLWPLVLGQLRRQFAILLVDAGALQSTIPHVWGRWATRTILVVDAARTSMPELERLRAEMTGFGIKLDAAILNKKAYHVPAALYRRLL